MSLVDRCITDEEIDVQFATLAHHQYCAKDSVGRHRNIGSVSLVRNCMTTGRLLRPCVRTSALQHIYELASSPSPMCSRPRLVSLPLAYPNRVECLQVVRYPPPSDYTRDNLWFSGDVELHVIQDSTGFCMHVASVCIPLVCVDASYSIELDSALPGLDELWVEPNQDPVDRRSTQAMVSFSCAVNLSGPCRERDDVDGTHLDVEGRLRVLRSLKGFLCPWTSHDAHKAGYELLPTSSCCVSRVSRNMVDKVRQLVKRTREVLDQPVDAPECPPPWSVLSMIGHNESGDVPIVFDGNLLMRDRHHLLALVNGLYQLKRLAFEACPECTPSVVLGTRDLFFFSLAPFLGASPTTSASILVEFGDPFSHPADCRITCRSVRNTLPTHNKSHRDPRIQLPCPPTILLLLVQVA